MNSFNFFIIENATERIGKIARLNAIGWYLLTHYHRVATHCEAIWQFVGYEFSASMKLAEPDSRIPWCARQTLVEPSGDRFNFALNIQSNLLAITNHRPESMVSAIAV